MNVTQSKAGNRIAVNTQQVHLVPIQSIICLQYHKRNFLLHQLKKNMDEEVVQKEIRQTSVLGVALKFQPPTITSGKETDTTKLAIKPVLELKLKS